MRFGVFIGCLSLAAGSLSGAVGNAIISGAFGGGLQGALLANSLGFGSGNVLNTFIAQQALSGSDPNNLLLLASLNGGANGGFGGNNALSTYFAANAFKDDPTDFFLAGALSGGLNNNAVTSAALADQFGGGFGGAILANAAVNGGLGYNNGPYANAYYNGYYNYNVPPVASYIPTIPTVSASPYVNGYLSATTPWGYGGMVSTSAGCYDANGIWQPVCTGYVYANTGCFDANGIWQPTCFL